MIDISFKKIFSFAKAFSNKLFEFFVKVEDFEKRGVKSLKIEQSDKNVTAINASDTFELYVITEDLNANPIAGNAQVLRDQASKCIITFNSYEASDNNPTAWIEDIIKNIEGIDGVCPIDICRASECTPILEDESPNKKEQEVLGYEACDCDIVLDVNTESKFVLYTVSYKDSIETNTTSTPNDITLVGLFQQYSIWSDRDDKAPEGAGDYYGIACKFIYPANGQIMSVSLLCLTQHLSLFFLKTYRQRSSNSSHRACI